MLAPRLVERIRCWVFFLQDADLAAIVFDVPVYFRYCVGKLGNEKRMETVFRIAEIWVRDELPAEVDQSLMQQIQRTWIDV